MSLIKFIYTRLKKNGGYQNKKIGSPKTRKALFYATSSFLALKYQGSG